MASAIRVLVCDDSSVIRRLVKDVLASDPEIEVVGTAINGKDALEKLTELRPDILTLDVEMPVMDGLQTLVEVRKRTRQLPIIMFSTLTERGAGATLDALERGASDYVTKPSNFGSIKESMEAVRSQLIPKIKSLTGRVKPVAIARPAFSAGPGGLPGGALPFTGTPTGALGRARHDRHSSAATQTPLVGSHAGGLVDAGAHASLNREASAASVGALSPRGQVSGADRPLLGGGGRSRHGGRIDILAIGISTGGPDALTSFISALPRDFPVPIVVTQHMPPVFTQLFAQRLNNKARIEVAEAKNGDALRPGRVLIAPGDYHMRVATRGASQVVTLDQGPQENYCRPAVDPMFRSVAEVYGSRALALVMTGMGHDGASGAEHIARAGGHIIVQDEASSVVWGMPGAVVASGIPCEIVPLARLAETVIGEIRTDRTPVAAGRPIS